MYKFFTIFFALLTLILAGCESTSPDPQITEEPQEVEKQLDLAHVKKTEEEEKRLEDLSNLNEKGLIDDDDYESKKTEILKDM